MSTTAKESWTKLCMGVARLDRMTGRSAVGKSVHWLLRPALFSLSVPAVVADAVGSAVPVNTFADWLTLPMTVGHMTNTCLSFARDSSDRSVRKRSACSPTSQGRRGDDLSSAQFERRNLASSNGWTRPCRWHMTRWNEIRRLSWCIADPAHVNNDFQLDYSAWCSCEISMLNRLLLLLDSLFRSLRAKSFLRRLFAPSPKPNSIHLTLG